MWLYTITKRESVTGVFLGGYVDIKVDFYAYFNLKTIGMFGKRCDFA